MKKVIYLLLVFLVGTASSALAQSTKFAVVDKFDYPRYWFTLDLDNQRLYEHQQKGGDYYYLIKEYEKNGDVHKFSLYLAHSPSFKVYSAELVLSGSGQKFIKVLNSSNEVRLERAVKTEKELGKKGTATQKSSAGSRVKDSGKKSASKTKDDIKEKAKKEAKKAIKKLLKF